MDSSSSVETCWLKDPDIPSFEVASWHYQRLLTFENLTVLLAEYLAWFLGIDFNIGNFFQKFEYLFEFFQFIPHRVLVYFPIICVKIYAKCKR